MGSTAAAGRGSDRNREPARILEALAFVFINMEDQTTQAGRFEARHLAFLDYSRSDHFRTARSPGVAAVDSLVPSER
jgi:hypothetical protein